MKNVIGIDIGGTKITGILFNGLKVIDQLTIATPGNLYDFEKNLLKLIDFLSAKKLRSPNPAIGIGIAGLVDSKQGIVRYSPNIRYIKDLKLLKFFKLNGYKTVKIDNDANCFTRAEFLKGQGKKYQNFIALTLGTGIGGGIVINGTLYRGLHNDGGELGHLVNNNVFLEKKFQIARDHRNNSELGTVLGQAFASFVNILSPQAIILGGGVVTDKSRNFLPRARTEMAKFLFARDSKTKIILSKLKNAGALGAALMVC
jgi:glucokinase